MDIDRLKKSFNWDIRTKATKERSVWEFASLKGDSIEYPEEGNDHCFELEEKSFWFKHRSNVICEFFKKSTSSKIFWEIGAGNGYVASCIKKQGVDVVTLEPGIKGAQNSALRGNTSLCGFLHDLELPDSSIPNIGCFDVLEHLDSAEDMLKEFYRILEPGGVVLITVPAHKYLWSQTDDMSYHKRRYERSELISVMESIGFKPIRCSYFFISMVIPMYILRSLPYKKGVIYDQKTLTRDQMSQMTGASSMLANIIISSLLNIERYLLRFTNLPTGTSLVGVFSK